MVGSWALDGSQFRNVFEEAVEKEEEEK